ncbi:MAG: alpha/beta fold hydrolase [Rhodospirillales bacterium]|nr:alpha/beta fold hydrolase [Rhodospirillales bacterium]
MIRSRIVTARGAAFHVAEAGEGTPILLLHGWPEFWRTWEPVMLRLGGRFRLIAPDLRGFGASDKPAGDPPVWGAADHGQDLLALLDALGIARCGVVGHDVGGAVILDLARRDPGRWSGLFLFDFVYPGIGARMGAPDRLQEIWYQSFHQMAMAPALVGASRDACRAYIGHFLRHWSHVKTAFDDVIEAWVDNFLVPGNLEGGFAWYRAAHAGRIAMMQGKAATLAPIAIPARIRWAAHDPIFPAVWTDRLGETFSDLDLAVMEGVGHFPHREAPERAAAAIAEFFAARA